MVRVYRLKNFTRRQHYYGTTEKSLRERKKEHSAGRTGAIKHWNWKKDKIEARTIADGLSQAEATKRAQKLEQRKPPPSWKNIQTGGR